MSTFYIIGIVCVWLWVIYEWWRAPLLRENPDGSFTTIKESKKITNLFKKTKTQ